MPTVICSDCDGKVSTKLSSCPHCGAPIDEYNSHLENNDSSLHGRDSSLSNKVDNKKYAIVGLLVIRWVVYFLLIFKFCLPRIYDSASEFILYFENLKDVNASLRSVNIPPHKPDNWSDAVSHLVTALNDSILLQTKYAELVLNTKFYSENDHELARRVLSAANNATHELARFKEASSPLNLSIETIKNVPNLFSRTFDDFRYDDKNNDFFDNLKNFSSQIIDNISANTKNMAKNQKNELLDPLKKSLNVLSVSTDNMFTNITHFGVYLLRDFFKLLLLPGLAIFLIHLIAKHIEKNN